MNYLALLVVSFCFQSQELSLVRLVESAMEIEWPAMPSNEPAPTEVFVETGPLYDKGMRLLHERLQDQLKEYGWEYDVRSATVSRNHEFPIIVRAVVVRVMDGHMVEFCEMLWRDTCGRDGGSGAMRAFDGVPVE